VIWKCEIRVLVRRGVKIGRNSDLSLNDTLHLCFNEWKRREKRSAKWKSSENRVSLLYHTEKLLKIKRNWKQMPHESHLNFVKTSCRNLNRDEMANQKEIDLKKEIRSRHYSLFWKTMDNHKNKIKSAKTKFRVWESITRREGISTL